MIYAEKGNRVKQIAEQDIQKYLEQGYSITNGAGEVIKTAVPTDLQVLKLAYTQNEEVVNSLKNEIKTLLTVIDDLKGQLDSANKALAERVTEMTLDKEVVEKPARTRSKKSVESVDAE